MEGNEATLRYDSHFAIDFGDLSIGRNGKGRGDDRHDPSKVSFCPYSTFRAKGYFCAFAYFNILSPMCTSRMHLHPYRSVHKIRFIVCMSADST